MFECWRLQSMEEDFGDDFISSQVLTIIIWANGDGC